MANVPTPEDIAWMRAHIDDTMVADIIICCSICAGASVIILALRIWSRFQMRQQLVVGDHLFIWSVVFFIACCNVFAVSTRYGEGRHIALVADNPADMRMVAIVCLKATGKMERGLLLMYGSLTS